MPFRLKVENQYIQYGGTLTVEKRKALVYREWARTYTIKEMMRAKFPHVEIEEFSYEQEADYWMQFGWVFVE